MSAFIPAQRPSSAGARLPMAAATPSTTIRLPVWSWQQWTLLGAVASLAAVGAYRLYSSRSRLPRPTPPSSSPPSSSSTLLSPPLTSTPLSPLPTSTSTPLSSTLPSSSTLLIAPLPSPSPNPSSSPSPSPSSSKPVIAVDLDEVLGEFVPSLLAFHNATYATSLTLSSFHSYLFHEVWGGSFDDAVHKVHAFFDSPHFHHMPPLPDALPTLTALSPHATFHIVTARQLSIQPHTERWVAQHFPHVFASIQYGNHFDRHGGVSRSKADMCVQVGARVLIDDSATHARAVAGVVDWVLLFDRDGTYNWSKGRPEYDVGMPDNVRRVHSWKEVEAFLRQYLGVEESKTLVV